MIFPLNAEYVVWEVVELARLHMCEVLKVHPTAVEARVELNRDKLCPEFNVSLDACQGLTPDQVREVVGAVYAECKEELAVRLYGMTKTRDDVQRELSNAQEDPGPGVCL